MIGALQEKLRKNKRGGTKSSLKKPDILEQRADLSLMVWGDIPYWLVADAELRSLLDQLDGSRTVNELLALPEFSNSVGTIHRILDELQKHGVLKGLPGRAKQDARNRTPIPRSKTSRLT